MKTYKIILGVLVVLFFACTSREEKARTLFEEGKEFLNSEDYQNALLNFQKSAELDFAEALHYLAMMHFKGDGVEKNDSLAENYFLKSALGGHTVSYNNIGVMYAKRKEFGIAKKWYEKSVEYGHAISQKNLGIMYQYGQAVEQDYEKAIYWYGLAVEQGYAMAQSNLANLYLKGEGVEQDYNEAFRLFKLSAEQSFWMGEYGYAYMYENGFGTKKDLAEAIKWYKLAESHGHEGASEALKRLEENKSP